MIFNLFKSKPSLEEIIPKGFIDIHSHILPDIDDGSKSIEDSLLMVNELTKIGFKKIIGTPHIYPGLYNNTKSKIESSYKLLFDKISDKNSIGYASEYMIDELTLKSIHKKNLLTVKDNLILIEMSYISEPNFLNEFIFELQNFGYEPILAHPERYRFWHNKFSKFSELKKRGVKFQMNLLSVTDYYGVDIRKFSDKLLNAGYIDFLGSDVHNIRHIKAINNKYAGKNFSLRINNLKEFQNAAASNCHL